MKEAWIATGLGLAAGLWIAYFVGNLALPRLFERSRNRKLLIKLAFGGTAVGLVPALLLSVVVGATLGATWGAIGIALAVAGVFALVLLAGTFAGVLLAKLFRRPEA